jgi:isopenicillin N synthase-like dioxygenase
MTAIKNLSVLDLERNPDAFTESLYDGLTDCGFVVLRDHGIDEADLKKAYELIESLFAQPLETKLRYDSGQGGARGYTAFGRENAKGNAYADLKEFWHVGQELPADSPYKAVYEDNVWPQELPEFKPHMLSIYRQLEELARRMLAVLAKPLGLEPDFFDKMTEQGNSVYRLLHYPAVKGLDTRNSMRAAPHADINLITLLLGATDSGLEILGKDGEWIPVESTADEIVLDTGDMMSRLTNEVFPSTVHRVVNPGAQNRSRFSMPFFLHPHSNASLACLPQCEGESGAKYPPITAGEFLQQRLREIGLLEN